MRIKHRLFLFDLKTTFFLEHVDSLLFVSASRQMEGRPTVVFTESYHFNSDWRRMGGTRVGNGTGSFEAEQEIALSK
jgi:hypothetical protein